MAELSYAARLEAAIERAAVMEHDGNVPRAIAEDKAALAWKVKVEEVRMSRVPAVSKPATQRSIE